MSFIAPLLSAGLGFLGQQNANNATQNAQTNAQAGAQQYSQQQQTAAKTAQQQALQQALMNLGQYQQQNPSPIQQLGAIQAPGAAQGAPAQSFGGGVQGSQAPGGQMQRPQMPQQNLQQAMQQPQQMPQQQPQANTQRLQQLYPLMQQMLASQGGATPQPMARSNGGGGI